ncbi:MAG TPA: hypothetical protein VGG69_00635, partial [Rhizomicrobium sp.]
MLVQENEELPNPDADDSTTSGRRRLRRVERGVENRGKASRKQKQSQRAGEGSAVRRQGLKSVSDENDTKQKDTIAGQGLKKRIHGGVDEKAARRAARRHARKGNAAARTDALQELTPADSMQVPSADLLDAAPEIAEEEALERSARDDEQDGFASEGAANAAAASTEADKPTTVAVFASDRTLRRILVNALQKHLKPSGVESVKRDADFVIDFGVRMEAGRLAARGRKATIVVAGSSAVAADTQKLAKIAKDGNAQFLPLDVLLRRYGRQTMLDEKGELNREGVAILAAAIGKLVRADRLKHSVAP